MFNRAQKYIGKLVAIRTKSGKDMVIKIDTIDNDGEVTSVYEGSKTFIHTDEFERLTEVP